MTQTLRLGVLVLTFAVPAQAQPGITFLACDAIVDNRPFLQALLNSPAGWQAVVLPAGSCLIKGTLELPDHAVTIRGQGVNLTNLLWEGADAGFRGRMSSTGSRVTIEDLLLGARQLGGAAIDLGYPTVSSSLWSTLILRDVVINGEWAIGVRCSNCWSATLDNVHIWGGTPASWNGFKMQAGIHFSGWTVAAMLDKVRVSWANTGLMAVGDVEGLVVTDSTFVGVRYGIDLQATHQVPHFALKDTHIAAVKIGIRMMNRPQATVRGALIYQWGGPHEGPFYGVVVGPGSEYARLSDNYIQSRPDNPGAHGIVLQSTANFATASNNTGVMLYSTVWVQPGCLHALVTNTQAHASRMQVLRQ